MKRILTILTILALFSTTSIAWDDEYVQDENYLQDDLEDDSYDIITPQQIYDNYLETGKLRAYGKPFDGNIASVTKFVPELNSICKIVYIRFPQNVGGISCKTLKELGVVYKSKEDEVKDEDEVEDEANVEFEVNR